MIIRNLVRKWLGLTALEAEIAALKTQLATNSVLIEQMYESTTVDADINYCGPNTVIIAGKFRGAPYVNIYSVNSNLFATMVETLKPFKRYLSHIDYPPIIRGRINDCLTRIG